MNTRLRKIKLYGVPGSMFGREFNLAVRTPAEAIRALCMLIPKFEHYLMNAHRNGVKFAVFAGKTNLTKEQLEFPSGNDVIRIAPILVGSKNMGAFTTIFGAILVVVGWAINVISGGALAWLGTPIIYAGVAMMAAGVVQMLAPSPKMNPDDRPENKPSYTFQGAVNTTAQGHCVPLLYGRMFCGSAVLSAGIFAEDVHAPVTTTPPTGTVRGGGGSPPWHLDWVNNNMA